MVLRSHEKVVGFKTPQTKCQGRLKNLLRPKGIRRTKLRTVKSWGHYQHSLFLQLIYRYGNEAKKKALPQLFV